MTAAMAARIDGDQVKCWNCPCALGQFVPAVEGGWLFAASYPYQRGADTEALPGWTILVIPPRIRERIKRTGLPVSNRRTRHRTIDGGLIQQPSTLAALPVLMPCWRPGCGQPNRIDTTATDSLS
jgi:hypothetical protein